MAILKFKTPKKKAEELAEQNYIKVSDDGKTYQLINKATGQVVTTDYMRQSGSNEFKPFSNRVSRGFERLAAKYVPKEEPKKPTDDQTTDQNKTGEEVPDKWKSLFDEQNKKIDSMSKEITALKSKNFVPSKGVKSNKTTGTVRGGIDIGEIDNSLVADYDEKTGKIVVSPVNQNTQTKKSGTSLANVPSFSKSSATVGDLMNIKGNNVPFFEVDGNVYKTDDIVKELQMTKQWAPEAKSFKVENMLDRANKYNFEWRDLQKNKFNTIEEAARLLAGTSKGIAFTIGGGSDVYVFDEVTQKIVKEQNPSITIRDGKEVLMYKPLVAPIVMPGGFY